MPRILPVPDMEVFEYVDEPRKGTTGHPQQNRARVLKRREPEEEPEAPE